jgi:hypothetical protein
MLLLYKVYVFYAITSSSLYIYSSHLFITSTALFIACTSWIADHIRDDHEGHERFHGRLSVQVRGEDAV